MITYALCFCQISMGKYGSDVSIFSQTRYTSYTPQNRPGIYLFSPTSPRVLVSPIMPYSGHREATEAQKIIEQGPGLCGQEKAPGRCGVGLGCAVFTSHYSWDSSLFQLSSYQCQKMMYLDNRSCVHSTLCYRNLCFLLCRIC